MTMVMDSGTAIGRSEGDALNVLAAEENGSRAGTGEDAVMTMFADSRTKTGHCDGDALNALEAIVGRENIQTDQNAREYHSRACIPVTRMCGAVVHPGSAEEIQQIFRVATRFDLRIWTFSGGNNWGYGTKNACHEGAVVLVLNRMNRILEVNDRLAYAVVEPGVTQGQLSEYLREKHPDLWLDVNDATPKASIVGNGIERGYGCTPHGDHFAHLCGLEVVLPNGELMRTGSPVSGNRSWNTHKWGCGPYIEGLFSQSNLGIVVKAGVWLLPRPEAFNMYSFSLDREADLPEAIDRLRELGLHGMVQSNTHMANTIGMLSVIKQYPRHMLKSGETFLSDEALVELRKRYGLGAWMLAGGIYGSRAEVRLRKKALRRSLGPLGRVQFFDTHKAALAEFYLRLHDRFPGNAMLRMLEWFRGFVMPEHIDLVRSLPGEFALHQGVTDECITRMGYFKVKGEIPLHNLNPARDGGGVICHAPAVPATGEDSREILRIVKPLFRKHGFDFFGCFTRMNERTNFMLALIYFDQTDPGEKARACQLFEELRETTDRAGYQCYRSGVMHYESAMATAPVLSRFLNDIKKTVDPHGIMAPGRYGLGG